MKKWMAMIVLASLATLGAAATETPPPVLPSVEAESLPFLLEPHEPMASAALAPCDVLCPGGLIYNFSTPSAIACRNAGRSVCDVCQWWWDNVWTGYCYGGGP